METPRSSKILDPYEIQGKQLVIVASPTIIMMGNNHIQLPTGMELTVQRQSGDMVSLSTDKIPGLSITITSELAQRIVIED